MSHMQEIRDAVNTGHYQRALDLATSSTSSPNTALLDFIRQSQIKACLPEGFTHELLEKTLRPITDDAWVASVCSYATTDDKELQQAIIRIGLERTRRVQEDEEEEGMPLKMATTDSDRSSQDTIGLLRQARQRLDTFQHRLSTFELLLDAAMQIPAGDADKPNDEEDEEMEIDDPWAESTDDEEGGLEDIAMTSTLPLKLSKFLEDPLEVSAVDLASHCEISALRILFNRHAVELYPYRVSIIEAIPPHVHPSSFEDLLPVIDAETSSERIPTGFVWNSHLTNEGASPSIQPPRNSAELSQWYLSRIKTIESVWGLVDIALAWVQHGAAGGVSGLDAIGEDLSLLSRLVYDATGSGIIPAATEDEWSLARWQSLSQAEVIKAYLGHSTPDTLADDIRRLVLPYLYVLDSRAERVGESDKGIFKRLLHEYILEAPLEMSLAVFEASTATVPVQERIIKSDLDVAKLALARLYGSNEIHSWSTMSRIFECLPVWDVSGNEDLESDREVTVTTLQSLGAFIRPSTEWPLGPGATELKLFFEPLPFASLSRALDILDVHLESGEVLERWDVAAPMRWLVQSAFDKGEQRSWAVRMARQAAESVERTGGRSASDAEWASLMDDMIKLSGGGVGLLRGAFGLLTKEEVLKAFFEGILSAGRFDVAKRLLRSPEVKGNLQPSVIEEVVLHASREFYENAATGNMHMGEMKLAYDCLSVSEATPNIRKERDFIEATSRISSYPVRTDRGDLMSPLEMRLIKDKLDLVARVLSSSDDAYRHVDVILDLTNKLGYRDNDSAHIRVLAMLTESAMQKPDFDQAGEICERIVDAAIRLQRQQRQGKEIADSDQAVDICWKTCSQLGKQSEYSDIPRKMSLLGRALQFCPPEAISELLVVWRRVEDGQVRLDEAARNRHEPLIFKKGHHRNTSTGSTTSVTSSSKVPQDSAAQLLGSRRAAKAASRLNQVAHDFSTNFNLRPLQTGVSSSAHREESSPARSESSDRAPRDAFVGLGEGGAEIKQQARRALVKGVGWLIGAGEEELQDVE